MLVFVLVTWVGFIAIVILIFGIKQHSEEATRIIEDAYGEDYELFGYNKEDTDGQ